MRLLLAALLVVGVALGMAQSIPPTATSGSCCSIIGPAQPGHWVDHRIADGFTILSTEAKVLFEVPSDRWFVYLWSFNDLDQLGATPPYQLEIWDTNDNFVKKFYPIYDRGGPTGRLAVSPGNFLQPGWKIVGDNRGNNQAAVIDDGVIRGYWVFP